MIAVVSHPKFPGQNVYDTRARPNFSPKAVGFGPMPKKVGNQPFLLVAQLAVRSPMRVGIKSLRTSFPSGGQPATYRSFGSTQCINYVVFFPAMLEQIQRPKSTPFTPIMRSSHAAYCKKRRLV
jgi:hypothetical protein